MQQHDSQAASICKRRGERWHLPYYIWGEIIDLRPPGLSVGTFATLESALLRYTLQPAAGFLLVNT